MGGATDRHGRGNGQKRGVGRVTNRHGRVTDRHGRGNRQTWEGQWTDVGGVGRGNRQKRGVGRVTNRHGRSSGQT